MIIEKKILIPLSIGCIVCMLSIFCLLYFLSFTWCEILTQTLVAIITGCIFSLPSTISYILIEHYRAKRNLQTIMESLEKIFFKIKALSTDEANANITIEIDKIFKIYYQLVDMQNEFYLFRETQYMSDLETALFSFCTKARPYSDSIIPVEERDECIKQIAMLLGRK